LCFRGSFIDDFFPDDPINAQDAPTHTLDEQETKIEIGNVLARIQEVNQRSLTPYVKRLHEITEDYLDGKKTFEKAVYEIERITASS